MIALDTNLLARLLLRDDVPQYARVRALMESQMALTAPVTVILELVWVLEANDCTPTEIVHGLNLLMGLPNFTPERPDAVRRALDSYAQGLDFADALHLALSQSSTQLASFDKAFAKKASKWGLQPVVVLL